MSSTEQTTPQFGVYVGPTGKLKVFSKAFDQRYNRETWELDEGLRVPHPILRGSVNVVKSMSVGWPVFDFAGDLKNYEYLGEL